VNENIVNKKKIEFDAFRDGECYRKYTLIFEDEAWKVDIMKISSLNWRSSRQVF